MYLPGYFREISRLGSIIAEVFNNLLRGMNHQVYEGFSMSSERWQYVWLRRLAAPCNVIDALLGCRIYRLEPLIVAVQQAVEVSSLIGDGPKAALDPRSRHPVDEVCDVWPIDDRHTNISLARGGEPCSERCDSPSWPMPAPRLA